jgi:hypothetical protein
MRLFVVGKLSIQDQDTQASRHREAKQFMLGQASVVTSTDHTNELLRKEARWTLFQQYHCGNVCSSFRKALCR